MKSPLLGRTDFFFVTIFSQRPTPSGESAKGLGKWIFRSHVRHPYGTCSSVMQLSFNTKGFPASHHQNTPRFYSVRTFQVSELCLSSPNCKRDPRTTKHVASPQAVVSHRGPFAGSPHSFHGPQTILLPGTHFPVVAQNCVRKDVRRGRNTKSLTSAVSVRTVCLGQHPLLSRTSASVPLRTFEQAYQRTFTGIAT